MLFSQNHQVAAALLWAALLLPALGGALCAFCVRKDREALQKALHITTAAAVCLLLALVFVKSGGKAVAAAAPGVAGLGFTLTADPLRLLLGCTASFVWLLADVYSLWYFAGTPHRTRFRLFVHLTLTGTLGVFFAGDWLTLFVFFEIMTVTTYPLVLHEETKEAHHAADLYLVMSVSGGMALLLGLLLVFDSAGSFDFAAAAKALTAATQSRRALVALLFAAGFGVKAGMVPLHIWLPKAHPVAPAPAHAILSGVILKTGIFGMLLTVTILLPGEAVLHTGVLVLGAISALTGGILALFMQNIKTILAYSSLSQMGLLLMGIGCAGMLGTENGVAVDGVLLHAVNHMVFKMVLFLSAGVLIHQTHCVNLDDLRGAGRRHPVLKICFLIGTLGIAGIPGFSGYTGKTLLHHALTQTAHAHHNAVTLFAEFALIAASACTATYMLKIVVTVFFQKPPRPTEESAESTLFIRYHSRIMLPEYVLMTGALPVLAAGLLANRAHAAAASGALVLGAHGHPESFFTLQNMVTGLLPTLLGIALYTLMQRGLMPRALVNRWQGKQTATQKPGGIENWVYRPVGRLVGTALFAVFGAADRFVESLPRLLAALSENFPGKSSRILQKAAALTRDPGSEGGVFSGINAALYSFGTALVLMLFACMLLS